MDDFIETSLKPMVPEECKRLKIPPEFIIAIYPRINLPGSYCMPQTEGEKIIGVKLLLDEFSGFGDFFQEMKHAQQYFYGRQDRPLSEVEAHLYEFRRVAEERLKRTYRKMKSYVRKQKN